MFSTLRASIAAAAIALAGLAGAGTAAAKPILPHLPVKPILHLCKPHYETNSQYLGIRKIGFHYYRVYKVTTVYVNVFCHKTVVRVRIVYRPLPWHFRSAPTA